MADTQNIAIVGPIGYSLKQFVTGVFYEDDTINIIFDTKHDDYVRDQVNSVELWYHADSATYDGTNATKFMSAESFAHASA